ncbi:MAG: hypothetical protein D9V47_14475 [Clostridia bacterium]|nr:MAG: hypothetical protein D9V47_14475 [Clostridia bacterium]
MKGISWRNIFLVSMVLVLALIVSACGGGSGGDKAPVGGGSAVAPGAQGFKEHRIGDEKQAEGLNVALVYFQPVPMEPEAKAGLKPAEADIHLEADITADANNPLGFGIGEFVPYLQVKYEIENLDKGEVQKGSFMPMNASDGPHYGANVKLGPAGTYRIAVSIKAPDDFLLHTDKETGVPGKFWTEPINLEWNLDWLPRNW